MLHRHLPLLHGDVGEERRGDDVSDGVDSGDLRLLVVTHGDEAPLRGDPQLLKPDAVRIARAADGNEDLIRIDRLLRSRLVFQHDADRSGRLLHRRRLGPRIHLDAALLEGTGEHLRDLRVFDREYAVHHFDEVDLNTEGVHHVR